MAGGGRRMGRWKRGQCVGNKAAIHVTDSGSHSLMKTALNYSQTA